MRPSTPSPTGTEMGAPVAVTAMPRPRPSLGESMMQRTVSPPTMLGHLHDLPAAVQLHLQSLLQLRQGAAVKGHVHHGAHDLYNGSLLLTHNGKIPFLALVCSVYPLSVGRYRAAWAPPTTSVISWVMAA